MSNQQEITQKELIELRTAIKRELRESPPTIGLVGVSGVGKSTTINTLFKTELPTSDTVACTKDFEAIDLQLKLNKGEMEGETTQLRIIDAPGLGENILNDPKYIRRYKRHLPNCDLIIRIFSARNRAVALDQYYLKELSSFHNNMVFALNQVDIVEPMNWDNRINLPSEEMEVNIQIIEKDRAEKLSNILQSNLDIISYSAKHGFNLEQLFYMVVEKAPQNRRWIFDGLKNFSYSDFIPEGVRGYLMD